MATTTYTATVEVARVVETPGFQDVSDWLTCLAGCHARLKSAGWDFITTLRDGIDQFGRTDHRKAELYELAGTQLGLSPRSLQTYVSVSRSAVAEIAMSLDLEFTHARAALGLDEEVARDLLSTAAEQGWEPARVGREAWVRKNTSQLMLRSENGGAGATEIDDEVPFNHAPRRDVSPTEWTAIDEYEQGPVYTNGNGAMPPFHEGRAYPLTAANHAVSSDPNYDGDEWYTPAEYIEAARQVMGGIDLDPASCDAAQGTVQATAYLSKEDDALRDEVMWRGRVWLNPPYSMPLIRQFVTKLLAEYEIGNISEAVVLTNNSSDTAWFHDLLLRFPACFTRGRVQFWRPDSDAFGARQGQTLFYLGDNLPKFRAVFSRFGVVVMRA